MPEHSLYNLATGFTKAIAKWVWAGCPMRSPEAVKYLYNTHCSFCIKRIPDKGGASTCNVCGCRIHPREISIRNKLALLTTECPDNPPQWLAGVDYSDEVIEDKEEMLYEKYQQLIKETNNENT